MSQHTGEAPKRIPEMVKKMIEENSKIQGLEEGREREMAQGLGKNGKETMTSE
jgi:hypothetical protein